jgi:hypothetical protein
MVLVCPRWNDAMVSEVKVRRRLVTLERVAEVVDAALRVFVIIFERDAEVLTVATMFLNLPMPMEARVPERKKRDLTIDLRIDNNVEDATEMFFPTTRLKVEEELTVAVIDRNATRMTVTEAIEETAAVIFCVNLRPTDATVDSETWMIFVIALWKEVMEDSETEMSFATALLNETEELTEAPIV